MAATRASPTLARPSSISQPPSALDLAVDRTFTGLTLAAGAASSSLLVAYILCEIAGQALAGDRRRMASASCSAPPGTCSATTFGILPRDLGHAVQLAAGAADRRVFRHHGRDLPDPGLPAPRWPPSFAPSSRCWPRSPASCSGCGASSSSSRRSGRSPIGCTHTLGWIPFFGTSLSGPGLLPAAIVLAIMILPTVAAISQDALQPGPLQDQGSRLRHGRDPVGGDPAGAAADRGWRHLQRAGAGLRPRARRDDGAGDADRQRQPDQPVAVRARQHAGLAAGVQLPRGRRRSSATR